MLTLLHVIPGSLFLLLAPIQFLRRYEIASSAFIAGWAEYSSLRHSLAEASGFSSASISPSVAFAKESASPSSARYRVIEIALDIVRFMPADPGGMFVVSVGAAG